MERPRGCLWLAVVVLVALTVGCTGQAPTATPGGPPSVGVRIPVTQPFRVIAGEGSVWVLSRGPMPCSPARPCTVARIDPGSNRLVGTPTRLPADGWDLASARARSGRPSSTDAWSGSMLARDGSARGSLRVRSTLGRWSPLAAGSSGPATMTSATRAARCPRSIRPPIAWWAASPAWEARRASPLRCF